MKKIWRFYWFLLLKKYNLSTAHQTESQLSLMIWTHKFPMSKGMFNGAKIIAEKQRMKKKRSVFTYSKQTEESCDLSTANRVVITGPVHSCLSTLMMLVSLKIKIDILLQTGLLKMKVKMIHSFKWWTIPNTRYSSRNYKQFQKPETGAGSPDVISSASLPFFDCPAYTSHTERCNARG